MVVATLGHVVAGWIVDDGRDGTLHFGKKHLKIHPAATTMIFEGGEPLEPRIELDRERIRAFCEKWRVSEFYLFGSVLREDFNENSDVDVLIKKPHFAGIGLYEWLDMKDELERIFDAPVDLVEAGAIRNPFRKHEIETTRELIYEAQR